MNDPIHPNSATRQDLICDQGQYWPLPLILCNPVVGSNPIVPDLSNPLDLTGYTFECLVKESYSKNAKTVATVIVQPTDLPNGKITLTLASTITSSIPAGDYVYYLKYTIGAESNYWLVGTFKVNGR